MTTILDRVCIFGLIAATFIPTAGEAQVRRQVIRPPAELITAFVYDNAAPGRTLSPASVDLVSVLLGQADYPPGNLITVLDGLEHIALTGTSSNVRAQASFILSMAGSRTARQPQPANVARLERIYAQSKDAHVRAAIVAGLGRAVESPRALVFLQRVAIKDPADYPGASLDALAAIASQEALGRDVLKRLHTTGAVHDSHARQWLDLAASQGYRIQ